MSIDFYPRKCDECWFGVASQKWASMAWSGVFVLVVSCAYAHGEDIGEVLREIHTSRQRLTTGSFKCIIDGITNGSAYRWEWNVKFDNTANIAYAEVSRGGPTKYLCLGCMKLNTVASFDEGADNGLTSALSVYDSGGEDAPLLTYIPRLRWIGLIPSTVMGAMYWHPDSVWLDVTPVGIKDEIVDSRRCLIIEWRNRQGVDFRAVVTDDKWRDVLSIQYEVPSPALSEAISTVWEHDEANDVSLPQEVSYMRREGGRHTDSETARISATQVNSVMSSDEFSLEQIRGLAPGTSVNWASSVEPPGERDVLIWDGKKIVERVGSPTKRQLGRMPRDGNNELSLWIIGFNLCAVAIIVGLLAIRWVRRRR